MNRRSLHNTGRLSHVLEVCARRFVLALLLLTAVDAGAQNQAPVPAPRAAAMASETLASATAAVPPIVRLPIKAAASESPSASAAAIMASVAPPPASASAVEAASIEPPPASAAPQSQKKDDAALLFVSTCSGCHSIGAGAMRGPDLIAVSPWPEQQVTSAVQSMQRKVGPLTPANISALVSLLKDAKASERIRQAQARLSDESETKAEPSNSLLGGALFFGKSALENGGMPCNSCHEFHGEGGNLGPDLSDFASQIDIETLASSLARAGFPVMRAAYQSRPITLQEAHHIAAFLKQARAQRTVALPPPAINSTGLGAGLAAFACALVYIVTRPKGIRVRLLQRAVKR